MKLLRLKELQPGDELILTRRGDDFQTVLRIGEPGTYPTATVERGDNIGRFARRRLLGVWIGGMEGEWRDAHIGASDHSATVLVCLIYGTLRPNITSVQYDGFMVRRGGQDIP
jgi:hypothetical protein